MTVDDVFDQVCTEIELGDRVTALALFTAYVDEVRSGGSNHDEEPRP